MIVSFPLLLVFHVVRTIDVYHYMFFAVMDSTFYYWCLFFSFDILCQMACFVTVVHDGRLPFSKTAFVTRPNTAVAIIIRILFGPIFTDIHVVDK